MTKPKKTNAKKVNTKKTSVKTTPKSSAKKAAIKKKGENVKLHHNFINSLKNLETFWDKQVINLKKQIETLRAKQEKISLKQKATKASRGNKKNDVTQQELTLLRDKLAEAKSSANKYAAMSKMIVQFEREWGNKPSETKSKASSTKNKKNIKNNVQPNTEFEPKSTLKDKKSDIPPPLIADEEIDRLDEVALNEEIDEDLEDIFMPQDDLSEFEVIEDFNTDLDEDTYDDYSS